MTGRSFAWVSVALAALGAGSFSGTSAAPVPKHLMPKDEPEPLCYMTRVGDRHVSTLNGATIINVVASVEKTPKGLVVRTEYETDKGERGAHNETVRVSAAGVEVLEYGGNKLDPTFWWVKLPHVENNEWPDQLNAQRWTGKTIGWEEVEVPAGKFRAIHVKHIEGPNSATSYWFAPGMGCVKWESGNRKREMTSFTPGK